MNDVQTPRCAKCDGAMTQGMVVDRADYGVIRVPSWIQGAPRRGRLGGVKLQREGRVELPVITFRCASCGFLESYAPARLFSDPSRH